MSINNVVVLGTLKPERGSLRVFGLDPVAHPTEVLGRIGYLSESCDLPGSTSDEGGFEPVAGEG